VNALRRRPRSIEISTHSKRSLMTIIGATMMPFEAVVDRMPSFNQQRRAA